MNVQTNAAKQRNLLPVLSYHTGAGWASYGETSTPEGAKRIIKRLLSDESISLIKNHGFQLIVTRRTPLMQELNGGPDGFIWSLGKVCGHLKKH